MRPKHQKQDCQQMYHITYKSKSRRHLHRMTTIRLSFLLSRYCSSSSCVIVPFSSVSLHFKHKGKVDIERTRQNCAVSHYAKQRITYISLINVETSDSARRTPELSKSAGNVAAVMTPCSLNFFHIGKFLL